MTAAALIATTLALTATLLIALVLLLLLLLLLVLLRRVWFLRRNGVYHRLNGSNNRLRLRLGQLHRLRNRGCRRIELITRVGRGDRSEHRTVGERDCNLADYLLAARCNLGAVENSNLAADRIERDKKFGAADTNGGDRRFHGHVVVTAFGYAAAHK